MANEKGQTTGQQIHRNSVLNKQDLAALFTIIGHDLKTPLSNIKGFSTLIEEEFNNYSKDELRQFNQQVIESAEILAGLLENLLHWGQIQSNTIKISFRFVYVHPIVEKSFNNIKLNAANKGVQLINDVDEDLQIYASKMMIEIVIRNLVDNALKYTPKGGSITVSSCKEGDYAFITVQDTGIGIPNEKLKKLFQTDGLLSESGTEGEKGTGLGLLICKELVEKNNGKIKVESEPDKGTAFYMGFPPKKF